MYAGLSVTTVPTLEGLNLQPSLTRGVSVQAEDAGDTVTFMFESQGQERISDFELKLMDIDSEQLGIPDTEYAATVKMPANEFARICKWVPPAKAPSLRLQVAAYDLPVNTDLPVLYPEYAQHAPLKIWTLHIWWKPDSLVAGT